MTSEMEDKRRRREKKLTHTPTPNVLHMLIAHKILEKLLDKRFCRWKYGTGGEWLRM